MHWQLLTVVLIVAAPAPAEDKNKDEELIQGNWTVVSREFIGKKTPEAELKALKVTIKDDTITTDDGKKKEKIPYKLDPSKKPKAIDLANTGIESKETTLAIYELDGDTLKICWSEKDPEHRATKFASDEDSGQTMLVLKREKKDADSIQGTWIVISIEENGKVHAEAEVKGMNVTIKDDGITFAGEQGKEKASFKLDPSKKPKVFDLLADGGTMAGIYELDKDSLKLCWAKGRKGDSRPTEFASKPGTDHILIVLKREKK